MAMLHGRKSSIVNRQLEHTINPASPHRAALALRPPSKAGDLAFHWLAGFMALAVLALIALVGWELFRGARLSLDRSGWRFLVGMEWNPVTESYGALPFMFGTFVSSLLALAIALPLSVATAVYLTELSPRWLRQPVMTLIELLAAVPSVILGLWGLATLVPWLRDHPFPILKRLFGFVPLFQGPIYGPCILAAAIILAIMILPIITSVSREVLRSVPDLQREAAYALGATRWEVTRIAVLSYAKRGIFGAAILGLGRALGETMAVTMVIGNWPQISASLFAPSDTLASAIANQFTEATTDVYRSALFELGLVLLIVTVVTNILARLLIGALGAGKQSRAAH